MQVKADPLKLPVYPSESDNKIWTEFRLSDPELSIVFPSAGKDLFVDDDGRVATYEATTQNGEYRLIAGRLAFLPSRQQAQQMLEAVVAPESFSSGTVKTRRKVQYKGHVGREVIYEKHGLLNFSRFYIFADRAISITVAFDKKKFKPEFEAWAWRFLDSLNIKVAAVDET